MAKRKTSGHFFWVLRIMLQRRKKKEDEKKEISTSPGAAARKEVARLTNSVGKGLTCWKGDQNPEKKKA